MRPRISARELRLLSLYLDKQLSPGEQQRLQKCLHENESLQQALEELKVTRRALRAMPIVRAPRNFTLTPQMVGYRPPRPAFPVMGFVSAMASFLFILVLAVDLMGVLNRQTKSVAYDEISQYEAAAPVMENAQEKSMPAAPSAQATGLEETRERAVEEMKAAEPASALTATPQATRAVTDQGAEGVSELPQAESFAKEAPAPSLGIAEDSAAVGEAVTSTVILEMELQPLETPTGQVVPETSQPLPAAGAQEIAPTPSPTAQEAAFVAPAGAADESEVSQDRPSPVRLPGRRNLWIVEGALALIALISGAVFIRRRGGLTR